MHDAGFKSHSLPYIAILDCCFTDVQRWLCWEALADDLWQTEREDKPYNANSEQSRREPQKPDERRVEPWPILLPLPNLTQHLHARAARRREGYFLLYRGRTQCLHYPRNNEPTRRRHAAWKVKWWNQRAWKELRYTVMSINGLSLSSLYSKLSTPPAQHNLCQHTEATNAGSRKGIKKKKKKPHTQHHS